VPLGFVGKEGGSQAAPGEAVFGDGEGNPRRARAVRGVDHHEEVQGFHEGHAGILATRGAGVVLEGLVRLERVPEPFYAYGISVLEVNLRYADPRVVRSLD
jgi:hypothetical protein